MRIIKRKVCTCIIMLISILATTSAFSLANGHTATNFDVANANNELLVVSNKLKESESFDKHLYSSIQSIKLLGEHAETCVKNGYEQIKQIDELLNDKDISDAIKLNTKDYQYLASKRSAIAQQTASCRVFSYRAGELLQTYANTIKEHTDTAFTASISPVWQSLDDNILSGFRLSTGKIYQESGLHKLTNNNIAMLIALLTITIIISLVIRYYCSSFLRKSDVCNVVMKHVVVMIKRYILLIMPIFVATSLLHYFLFTTTPIPIIISLGYAMLAFISTIALADFVLHFPAKDTDNLLDPVIIQRIFSSILLVCTVVLAGYVCAIFLREQELSEQFIAVSKATYVTFLLISVLLLCWATLNLPFLDSKNRPALNILMKLSLVSTCLLLIGLEWLGYHEITFIALKGAILSAFFVVASWGVILLIEHAFTILEDSEYHLSQLLRLITNLKPSEEFIEFYTLRIALYIIFAAAFLVGMMHIWGASLYNIDLIKSGFLNGFPLLDVTINPSHLVIGLIAFSVIHLIGRIYSARLERRHAYKMNRDSQVAIASIINYLSFTLAVIIGLLVAGVNFTGLAIIAGALSVGIGFGLQNIVNNFLSGLILLIQQPIKPGDRIIVDDIEGFVIKIRILSTQIKTLAKEDVIIPNSSLTSHPVKNYMFRDSFWRVTCRVGVMYGSDTELVKRVLLEIGSKHPDVLQDDNNKPFVHFKAFGDSALLFEMWCVIKDVNKKFHVETDLNFAIDNAFRKHHIVIAFPQRDLHIKEIVRAQEDKTKQT